MRFFNFVWNYFVESASMRKTSRKRPVYQGAAVVRSRSCPSNVWNHFRILDGKEDGTFGGICLECSAIVKGNKRLATSNLWLHLERNHAIRRY